MSRYSSRQIRVFLAAAALSVGAVPSLASTLLFQEDFEGIPLLTSPTYGVANAYSQDPPPGWDIINVLPPGGVPEWRGWSFARKGFWQAVGDATGDQQGRFEFKRGSGTIAVADPDLWNSPQIGQGDDPANRQGFFNSFLLTPVIDLSPRLATENRLTLSFDSSWLGIECCDDGEYLDSPLRHRNNQTAVVRVRIDGGAPIEVLRWESAPFRDINGFPTDEPFTPGGLPNTPNPFHRRFELDERVFIDLSDFLDQPFALATEGAIAAMSSGGGVQVEFGMEGAGDDGWWGVDNIEMASYGTLLGDMNYSGALDLGDYDAFALGMLDTDAYRIDFGGAYPVENGSIDDTFDFDDIPWFLSVMESVGKPSTAYAQAFFGIPEPTTTAMSIVATLVLAGRRRAA